MPLTDPSSRPCIISMMVYPTLSRDLRLPARLQISSCCSRQSRPDMRDKHWAAAHVAGTLHVVLTSERVDACAGFAHIARHHGQIGQGLNIVHTVGMLRDAHGIQD